AVVPVDRHRRAAPGREPRGRYLGAADHALARARRDGIGRELARGQDAPAEGHAAGAAGMPQAARRGARARSGLRRIPVSFAAVALIAAFVAMATVPAAAAPPQTARTAACGLYRALDRRCGCAADDYFRGYGEKYCERFMHATGWSAAGLRWRNQTLVCLKNE